MMDIASVIAIVMAMVIASVRCYGDCQCQCEVLWVIVEGYGPGQGPLAHNKCVAYGFC